MSQMDTASKWLKMRNELDESIRQDYLRLDVSLENIPCTIDNANGMDEYRNLVIRQPGSNRMAREVATALLVGRLYMALQSIPERISGGEYVVCHGMIRCKGPVLEVIKALEQIHEERMDFVNGTEHLAHFGGTDDICPACGRYSKPVSLLLRHCDETVNLSLRFGKDKTWKINGFPTRMSSLLAAQRLGSAFGAPYHGFPSAMPCDSCGGKANTHGTRRRREPDHNTEQPSKRFCRFGPRPFHN